MVHFKGKDYVSHLWKSVWPLRRTRFTYFRSPVSGRCRLNIRRHRDNNGLLLHRSTTTTGDTHANKTWLTSSCATNNRDCVTRQWAVKGGHATSDCTAATLSRSRSSFTPASYFPWNAQIFLTKDVNQQQCTRQHDIVVENLFNLSSHSSSWILTLNGKWRELVQNKKKKMWVGSTDSTQYAFNICHAKADNCNQNLWNNSFQDMNIRMIQRDSLAIDNGVEELKNDL